MTMIAHRFVVKGLLIVLAILCSATFARAELTISYLGPAEAHLKYSYNATAEGDRGVKLVAIKTGGSETKLDPVDAPYGPLSFSGTLRHADLDRNGEYRYELRVVYKLPSDTTEQERTVETSSMSLNDSIWGTLLFDETINAGTLGIDPLVSRGVTVPAGTTLTFDGPATLTGSSIYVDGQIALSSLCDTQAISWIYLQSPHTFTELNKARLSFATTAAGSSIAKGSDLTLSHTGGDLLVQNVKNLVITTLPWEGGTLTLENIKPWLVDNMPGPNQAPYLGAGSTLHLKNVDVLLPKDYAYTFYFHPHGGGIYLFEDCLFDTRISFSVEGIKPNNITFRRSKFKLSVGVIGGAPVFEECEFGSDVTLYNRTAATFRKNAFWGRLNFANNTYNPGIAWNADGTDLPTIDENSFYGQYALFYPDKCSLIPKVPTPIPIGSGNYFGDDQGFVPLADPCNSYNATPDRFLTKRGAMVVDKATTGPVFDIPGFASTPTLVQKDKRVQPSFWLINAIIGQNTIPHVATLPASPLLQGKETLICLELATNDNRGVAGLQVYAKVDGTTVQTMAMPSVRRDVTSYTNKGGVSIGGASAIANGIATLNFVLPPVNKASAKVEIYLDQSAITGYDFDGDGVDDPGPTYQPKLLTQTLNFASPYGRRLNVLFHTVQIVRGPFDDPRNTKDRALTKTRNDLLSYLPGMFPIRPEDLALYHIDEQRVISTSNTVTGLLNDLAPIVELVRKLYEKRTGVAIDFQVAILPANSMGADISGANFSNRRQILFVDEDKLTAIVHEMGHGLGMYRNEQYDQFPPDGLFVENVTAFVNTPNASIGWMNGGRRVQHIVAKDHPHYTFQDWMDLMSRSDYPVWPIPSSLASFYSAFRGLLGTGTSGAQSLPTRSPAGHAAPLSDVTRVMVLGRTARTTEGGADLYRLQAESIRAMAVDSSLLPSLPAQAAGPGDAYRLEAFDAAGGSLSSGQFYVTKTNPYSGDTLPETDVWYATFDLPEGTARYTISRVADGQKVFEAGPSGGLSCSLTEPAAGTTLGERVQVKWSVTPSAPVNASQPIQSMAFLRPDGGTTWQPATLFHELRSLGIATESLSSGSSAGLRVISSDGLRSCMMQVSGLSVGNRPPAVKINSPREGDAAPADFAWTLSAEALDVESGRIDAGVWESSIDGPLGTTPVIEGIVLSEGTHTLTYRVQDAANATASAQVHVTVGGGTTGVDLFFAEDALRVTPPGTDPVYKPTVTVLKTGALHSAALRIRNGGIAVRCDLELHLQDPSAGETLIASRNGVSLEPFAEFLLPASFTPAVAGTYRFRAVVKNSVPEESNPANNERTWTLYTEPTKIVLAPLSSGSWPARSTMTVSWTFSGYLGNTVSIDLLQSGSVFRTLASAEPVGSGGTGTFSWVIPRDFPVGANYRIRITSLSDPSVSATSSGAFEILPPEPTLQDAINVLRVMAGLPVPADAMAAMPEADANGRIGLPESIFILQKSAGVR
ncbi:MAG: GPI anchored serine-threonine rich family protein [Deltaproteobacteria bacterium]|nr:GPI anchored serine-threonine rich family protein [Deltaproteobacteria bacterium]